MVLGFFFLAACVGRVVAEHRDIIWNITTVKGVSPDGSGVTRDVIGVNNAWPLPVLEWNYGDTISLTLNNQMETQTTSLHAHGFFQNGTNWADGPPGVTQCPIPPGSSFTYNYTLTQNGTYWIHSHTMGQFPDGLRGPLIIKSPTETYDYDGEFVIWLSDWYHKPMTVLKNVFNNANNPTGAEPVPDAALMNDSQNVTFAVEPNKVYRLRFINVAAFSAFHVWIDDHQMEVIETDGVDTINKTIDGFVITTAQRYSVLVRTKNTTDSNFAIQASMDEDMFDTVPDGLNNNVTGYLVYDSAKPLPTPVPVDEYPSSNDFEFYPVVEEGVVDADDSFNQDIVFETMSDGINYAFFNNNTYTTPKVPTIFTTITAGEAASVSEIYGDYTASHVLNHMDMVEMVLNNQDAGKHPFHLHGHTFQVIKRSEEDEGDYNPANTSWTIPANPLRRDTLQLPPNGHAIIRFRADNPGIWLFHCHIEWHVMAGLVSTMVEAPMQFQASQMVPDSMKDICTAQSIPIAGNAAANTVDLFNLDGQNKSVKALPKGFTGRGIVAMFFSALSALLGMGVIAWYGLGEMADKGDLNPGGTEREEMHEDSMSESRSLPMEIK